ncbi:uncharacterized membrane protein YcaP (DUF421 family) [Paenibacillus mucilaginosus]|uniref:DUF421 domain-containing protein n=1 Tax=Paenibacillus mucilaginosus TaxID=61624 RepID=UPI003D20ABC3
MEFFTHQESLTAMQWVLRAVTAYLFLMVAARSMGERSISQLRLTDLIIALLLGNIIAHPLSDEELGLEGSMITSASVIFLYVLTTKIALKWSFLRHYLEPAPLPLIRSGRLIREHLHKARLTIDYLFTELRAQGVDEIGKVELALWEPGGILSLFLKPEYQPVTPAALELSTEPFHLPMPVIKDGRIDRKQLHVFGHTDEWLLKKLAEATPLAPEEILLATLDDQERLQVYAK